MHSIHSYGDKIFVRLHGVSIRMRLQKGMRPQKGFGLIKLFNCSN